MRLIAALEGHPTPDGSEALSPNGLASHAFCPLCDHGEPPLRTILVYADGSIEITCQHSRVEIEAALTTDGDDPGEPGATDDPEPEKPDDAGAPQAERKSQATILVELVAARTELWHTPEAEAFATLKLDGHHEHHRLRSAPFKRWASREFYLAEEKAPGTTGVNDALTVLEGEAVFEGAEHAMHTRVAGHDGRIYLDLGDSTWRAVEISRDGWRVVEKPPVRFIRSGAARALPMPVPGGKLETLRTFLNVKNDDAWKLIVAWLIAAFRPLGPYPVLELHGEQGSAKSTAGRVVRRMVDPNKANLRRPPRESRDLIVAASHSWVVAFDNLSYLPDWLSDDLCCLATGGGYAARQLYTDSEEVVLDVMRPVILNGIGEAATRGDLVDRALAVELEQIPEDKRKVEEEFWRSFETEQPKMLGALLDIVSGALARVDEVKMDGSPRMADFARWVVAAEPTLGWEEGTFLAAYRDNRRLANELPLLDSLITEPLRTVAKSGYTGTASQLLDRMNSLVDEATTRRRGWPKAPQSLSHDLRRLAPNLRADDVEVTFTRNGHDRRRVITLKDKGVGK